MLALREMAAQQPVYSHILPIIEPLKYPDPSLTKTIDTLDGAGMPYAVVLNSHSRALRQDGNAAIRSSLQEKSFVPALLCDGDLHEVLRLISDENLSGVMLVFKDSIDSAKAEFDTLINHPAVHVVVGQLGRSLKKQLKSRGVSVVSFKVDAFRTVVSNAQYADAEDEKYSEEHAFFEEDGFAGFADFCVLPKDMPDGGMTPTTLAIHLTYQKNDDEIWVHHFLSDTRFGRENIQRKFYEAAVHVRDFYTNRNKTQAVRELLDCLEKEHYPGLGVLKKFSIWNHLELINTILEEQANA